MSSSSKVVTSISPKQGNDDKVGKQIHEFQKLNKELDKIQMHNQTKRNEGPGGSVANKFDKESDFNTLPNNSQVAALTNKDTKKTHSLSLNPALSAPPINAEYNALAMTSYLSPAQHNKTRGFVDFDL